MNRKKLLFVLVFNAICGLFTVATFADDASECAKNRVILKLTPKAAAKSAVYEKLGHSAISGVASIDNVGVKKIKKLCKKIKHPNLDKNGNLSRTIVFEVPQGRDLAEVLMALSNDSNVESVELDGRVRASYIPNDTYYTRYQWYLNNTGQTGGVAGCDISAEQLWDKTQGNDSTIIAIVDTGVDWDHEDLISNMWSNADEIAGNSKDDDGNGFVDDAKGWDFVSNDSDPDDDKGHGTHVAGIAAAKGNNGKGVAGVVWNCKIMPVKVLDSTGSGWDSDVAEGIVYAADNGAKIINLSLGGPSATSYCRDACSYAWSKGCIIVAASGNDAMSNFEQYPACYPTVISVGATDSNDLRYVNSNYGPNLEITAPGAYICSTYMGNGYRLMTGTSMATPVVSGSAAMVWAMNPTYTNTQVRSKLHEITDDLGPAGRDDEYGYGRINISKLLISTNTPPSLTAIGSKTVAEGSTLTFTVTATDSDGDAITYSASGLPNGASFDSESHTFTWTPDYSASTSSPYKVTFNVSDGKDVVSETVSITVTNVNLSPVTGTVTPSSSAIKPGVESTITATYTDPDGYSDIKYCYFMINTSTNTNNCLYFYYKRSTNTIYMKYNNTSTYYSGVLGTSGKVENSYCSVNLANTQATSTGTTVTLKVAFTPKSKFTGAKNLYLAVQDNSGVTAGWNNKGTVTITK